MTKQELLVLVEGERVEVRLQGGRWVQAIVEVASVAHTREGALLTVRREKPSPGGRRPRYHLHPSEVRAPRDPRPANVYADWLADNGFHAAADALRSAFPLDRGTPPAKPDMSSPAGK